jgi:hypothetical protein
MAHAAARAGDAEVSQEFQPGPPANAHRAAYGSGAAGHAQSLELMRQKIREGRLDPRVAGWAGQALRKRGIDGRSGTSQVRQQVQALLDEYRSTTVYTPDAVGTEYIQGAAATLCLSPDMCILRADCDDGVVAVLSAILAIGIPGQIVKEDYGTNVQSHVLVAARDERGNWFYADPSTNDPITNHSHGKQTWYDPMVDAPIEIVGVGRPGGFGATPATLPTAAQVTSSVIGNYVDVPSNTVQAGLRYAVGIVAPATWTSDDATAFFAGGFLVDTVQTGNVVGGYTSWIMIGLARTDAVLANTATVSIAAVLQEVAPPAAQAGPGPTGTSLAIPPAPPQNGVALGTVLTGALGLATVGGIAWGLYNRKGRR